MKRVIIQRTLECSICGVIPEDGELLWEIEDKYQCGNCAVDKPAPEIPQFEGTRDDLEDIGI